MGVSKVEVSFVQKFNQFENREQCCFVIYACNLRCTFQELANDVRRFSEQVKTLQNEKESLSQQLKESLDTLNQLSHVSSKEPDLHKSQDVLGKLLAEKFNLEDQVFTKLVNSKTSGQPHIFPPK